MAEYVENLFCPIAKKTIDIGLCSDIQDVVDNMVKERILEDDFDFNLTDVHKEMCRSCKKRIDPRL